MKKKYILSLIVIGILFALTLTIGTGYGLYLSTSVKNETNATTLDCFKAYFSHSDIIELKNINPVVNDEGKETSPYTLTITNICEETKELQIRLNVLSETTFVSRLVDVVSFLSWLSLRVIVRSSVPSTFQIGL